MPLDFQNVSIPFNQGLDTKTDEKLVLPGKLIDLQNGVFTEGNKIRKRYAWQNLNNEDLLTGSDFTSGEGIASYKDELIEFADNSLYSYSLTNDGWIDKGDITSCKLTTESIIDNNYAQSQQDCAQNANILVFAWKDGRGGIRTTVIDAQTGAHYITDTELTATGERPRCVAVDTFIFVFYRDSTAVKYRKMNVGVPTTFQSETTVKSDLDATYPFFDAAALGTNLLVTYHDNSNEVHLFYWVPSTDVIGTAALGLGDEYTATGESAENCLNLYTLDPDDQNCTIMVAYHNTTNGVRCFGRKRDLTQQFAVGTLDSDTANNYVNITGVKSAANTVKWWYELDAAANQNHLVKTNTIDNAGSTGSTAVFMRSVGLGTDAFLVGTDPFVGLVHDSTLQSTYFISNVSAIVIARIHPSQAGGLAGAARLPRLTNTTGSTYIFASLLKGRLQIEDSTFFNLSGVAKVTIDFDSQYNYPYAELGETLLIGGGQVFQYDGNGVYEYGFHVYPENLSSATSGTGGSMSDGTYSLRAVYEWIDAKGQRHRSSPSPAVSVSLSGGGSAQKITITIPTLRITAKSNVTIHLYSTEDSGSIYYRTTSVASPTYNNTAVDTVDIDRTEADSTLIGNEILYTTGGIVENIAPPSAHIITSHQNRVYIAGLDNENEIWFSKEWIKGEAIAFTDLFVKTVERFGGPITQLASLDDKLIIFKENRIYFMAGRGPNTTGLQDDFTEPQLITSDTGCRDPRSVVLMPLGLMYKGAKGIQLLDRSLQIHDIGADVEAYEDETITSAILMEELDEVRFTTQSSVALVYNYYYNQWSTFTNYLAEGAVNWNGTYTHLKSDGRVRKEVADVFLDEGTFYKLLIETAWLKTAGLQGFQRVRRMSLLGEYKSDHTLQTTVFYDYEQFFRHTILFNATTVLASEVYGDDTTYGESTVYGGAENGVYQFRAHMPRQKCQAVKFRFEDMPGSNPGESFSLSDLTLEVGIKRGIHKMTENKTL